jgi:hypothetical protein
MRQLPEYWIATYRAGKRAAMFYANADTSSTIVGESVRSGPFKLLRARLWAWRHGYGWVAVI